MTVEWIADVDVAKMASWISAIPFRFWPQQHPVDEQLRPAMVTDLAWHKFGVYAIPIVRQLDKELSEVKIKDYMLSVVMPGHEISPHKDTLGIAWSYRVHVPLVTNTAAKFIIGSEHFEMLVGGAYKVDISREHAVRNDGAIPRIHFMFDCYKS